MEHITTGVDRLASLIEKRRRISVEEAAKELQVSKGTIEDWVGLLESQGILTSTYGFHKQFIEYEKHTNEGVGNVEGASQALIRKIEHSQAGLEREFEKLNALQEKLKDTSEIIEKHTIQKKIKKIKKLGNIATSVEKDIKQSTQQAEKRILQVEKYLDTQEKHFKEVLEHVQGADEVVKKEKKKQENKAFSLTKMDSAQQEVHSTLNAIEQSIRRLERKQEKIASLLERVNTVKKGFIKAKEALNSASQEQREKEKHILSLLQEKEKNLSEREKSFEKVKTQEEQRIGSLLAQLGATESVLYSVAHPLEPQANAILQAVIQAETSLHQGNIKSAAKQYKKIAKDFERLKVGQEEQMILYFLLHGLYEDIQNSSNA